jgi:TIR domain-containing protein/pentapeptide repeat protein
VANPEHLEILHHGVKAWNSWRKKNPSIIPDLSNAQLSYLNYRNIDLSQAYLLDASLYDANMSGANLMFANLTFTDINTTNLRGANLRGANLTNSNARYTNLIKADLRNAVFAGTDLSGSDLSHAIMGGTNLGGGFLDRCIGLNKVIHSGPSSLGIDVIYYSKGSLPEEFLRGCGVADDFITYASSLTTKAIEFHSCFISYSSQDQNFVYRFYADLQAKGVRCWFAPEDLKIGDKTRVRIDESIRVHEKLLVILSKHSITSNWVEKEVETAMEQEHRQKRTVLFPIRVDDEVMKVQSGWPADIRRTRNIGDFRLWKNKSSYQKAFARLLRDLHAEE